PPARRHRLCARRTAGASERCRVRGRSAARLCAGRRISLTNNGANMAHLIDAQRLVSAFKESHDAYMPGLVFALLDYYFESGPFEFDAGVIAQRLNVSKFDHLPPEVIAEFELELQRFFTPTTNGWAPRP